MSEPQIHTSAFGEDMLALSSFRDSVPVKWGTRNEIYGSVLPKGGSGAEVGVLYGTNAENMLLYSSPHSLVLVDSWKSAVNPDSPNKPTRFTIRSEKKYKFVVDRFAKEKRVKIWRCYSFEAATAVENGSLDWVYIDANHRYATALLDIQMWTAKLKVGGYMMCHDFTMKIWNGGVVEAIKYVMRRPGELEIVGRDGEGCSTVVLRRTKDR